MNSVPNHDPVDELDQLDDDDRPIGRILSRREVLALMGAGSVAVVAAACTPGAVSTATGAAGGTASTASGVTAPATAVAVSSLPSCVVVPEVTEGPYYVDEKLGRSDIRIDTADGAAVAGTSLRID